MRTLDVFGPAEVFGDANWLRGGHPAYKVNIISACADRVVSMEGSHFYEFGPYRVDTAERRLLRGEPPVPFTPKAFETLLVPTCGCPEPGGLLSAAVSFAP